MKQFIVIFMFVGLLANTSFSQSQAEIEKKAEPKKVLKEEDKKINISKELKLRAKEMAEEERAEKKASKNSNEQTATNSTQVEVNEKKDTKIIVDNNKINDSISIVGFRKLVKKGDKLLKFNLIEEALAYYEVAWFQAKKSKHKVCLGEKIGNINYDLRNYKKAEKYFTTAVALNTKPKKFPLLEFQLANTYKYLAKYDAAIEMYTKFGKLQSENDKVTAERRRARLENKGAIYAQELATEDLKYTIENAGENVNSSASEFGPELVGNDLFFGKIYTDKENISAAYSKIYFSEFFNDKFSVFQEFDSQVNKENVFVGNPSFSLDGNTVYFTECTETDQCKIMMSQRENTIWQTPTALNKNINKEESNNTQPQITKTPEGKEILFFVSDRKGSRGGKDLWLSYKNEDGNFERPKRVESPINTTYDEISPFFHAASNTLYFSSNGHVNIGGFDVFKVENFFDNDDDLKVVNMDYPINSSVDDFDFIINNNQELGFLVSNRKREFATQDKKGCDDAIYVVKTTAINLFAKTIVYAENKTSKKIFYDADLFLYNAKTNEKIEQIKYADKTFLISIEKDMEYKIVAESNLFEKEEISFNTIDNTKSDTLEFELYLKNRNFDNYSISKVYYQFNSSNLRADAPDSLQKVLNFMNAYPNVVVEVGSHTDSKGTDAYNLALGKRRAEAVANYLIKTGEIAEERLQTKSYGESEPIAPNINEDGSDNPEGRDLNRRTEFKVVGKL